MKQHNSDLSGGYSDYVLLPKLDRNQHNPNFIPRFQWFRPQFTLRMGPTLSPHRYTGTMRTRYRQPNPPPLAGDAQGRRQCTPPLAPCTRHLHTTTGLSSSMFMVSWRVTFCVVLHPVLAPGGSFSAGERCSKSRSYRLSSIFCSNSSQSCATTGPSSTLLLKNCHCMSRAVFHVRLSLHRQCSSTFNNSTPRIVFYIKDRQVCAPTQHLARMVCSNEVFQALHQLNIVDSPYFNCSQHAAAVP